MAIRTVCGDGFYAPLDFVYCTNATSMNIVSKVKFMPPPSCKREARGILSVASVGSLGIIYAPSCWLKLQTCSRQKDSSWPGGGGARPLPKRRRSKWMFGHASEPQGRSIRLLGAKFVLDLFASSYSGSVGDPESDALRRKSFTHFLWVHQILAMHVFQKSRLHI